MTRYVGATLALILVCTSCTAASLPASYAGLRKLGKPSLRTIQRQQNPEDTPTPLDIDTLLRGRIYAINVDGSSFRLAQVDHAWLSVYQVWEPAALTRQLRSAYPGENVGWAWYADTYAEDGWYRLEIRIDEDAPFPDIVKARAAGFVEGNLQGSHMYSYWTNYRVNQYRGRGEAPSRELYGWLDEQYRWMARRVEAATGWSLDVLRGTAAPPPLQPEGAGHGAGAGLRTEGGGAGHGIGSSSGDGDVHGGLEDASDRRYWALVGLVAAQFEGLTTGFWAGLTDPDRNMTWHELYTLNALGDLYELNVLFPPGEEAEAEEAEAAQAVAEAGGEGAARVSVQPRRRRRQYSPGHGEVGEYGYGELLDCSAIIKIDPRDGGDDDGGDGGGDVRTSGDNASGSYTAARPRGDGSDGAVDDTEGGGNAGDVLGRRGAAPAAAAATAPRQRSQRRLRRAQRPRRVQYFWAAHNTWRSYFEMVRTWKVFDLPWGASGPLIVSSSPGLLHSKDDWYTTDKFVIMETTNGIYNKDLYDLIQPHCVLMWQRAQVANFGARSGGEWVDLFQRHNSGTYNNQWMVLDVPRLEASHGSGVLWVLEQVPGRTVAADVSKVLLEQGYWASYNVPYFPEIYNLTGYPHPSIYATCPRARIFSREQGGIATRGDLQRLMRFNRYQQDPLSDGMPNAAIAARYDLPAMPDAEGRPRNWTQRAYGAVDVKVVDAESFRQRRTYVVNGPTSDDQPAFSWSAQPLFEGVRHEGLPDTFAFGWHAYQTVMRPPLRQQRKVGE